MEVLLTVVLWILMGTATSYFANQRGRDPFAWFLIGMLLGLLGLLLLFLLPPVEAKEEKPEGFELEEMEEAPEKPVVTNENYRFKDWFYLDDKHHQLGPYNFQAFRKVWDQGKVSQDTFVWTEGMENWKKIEDLPGFQESLN